MQAILVALFAVVWSLFWSLLMALPVKWLWNSVLVDYLFPSVRHLTWLAAWGLSLLCEFLFHTRISGSKS